MRVGYRCWGWRSFLASLVVLGGCAALPPAGPILVPAVRVSQWTDIPPETGGLRAQDFIDRYAVLDAQGRRIGDVDNLVLAPNGRVSAIVAEAEDAFARDGETLTIPWEKVRVVRDREAVVVAAEALGTEAEAFSGRLQATDVLDAFLPFTGLPERGYVEDFVFDEGGNVLGVIANLDMDSALYERYDGDPGGYRYGLRPDFILYDPRAPSGLGPA